MVEVVSGRSIPDGDLELIDRVWGGDVPAVRSAVQKLRGEVLPDGPAMACERELARAVSKYTLGVGKALAPDAVRVLLKLAPCVEDGPYGIGSVWVDMRGAAKLMSLSEAHVRRMIITDKIQLTIIRRPSSGNLAKKRWIRVEDLRR